jgi:hypothetical protein
MRHVHVHGQGEGYFDVTNWALHEVIDYSKQSLEVERENSRTENCRCGVCLTAMSGTDEEPDIAVINEIIRRFSFVLGARPSGLFERR